MRSASNRFFAALFGAAACCLTAIAAAATGAEADLVFLGGTVHTVDPAHERVAAVAVQGERIVYLGDETGVRIHIGPRTRVVDLEGRMLLPGFQDSHVHPASAPNPQTSLGLHGLLRREQVFERIRAFAAAHPDKSWIVGEGWDEAAFLPSGRPTRQMLDALVPDRPAFLWDNAAHGAWVNSRALALAGITAETPDPVNGHIERDAAGHPSGMLHEDSAMALVSRLIPPPSAAEAVADLEVALAQMSSLGITAVVDAMATPAYAEAWATLDRAGRLAQRTELCLPYAPERDDDEQLRGFVAQRAALAGKRLSANCVKLFLDGAYGSHTLVLLEPYADEPQRFGSGTLFIERERLQRLVSRLDAEGFMVHMHAQGDGAVRAALDAIAAARAQNGPSGRRHTIAHLCLVDDADKPRFAELGVVANMSPLWMLGDAWETVFAPRLFGPVRSQRIFETRTLLARGATVAWGSDWPVTGVAPLEGIETATTRRYPGGRDPAGREDRPFIPGEAITLEQAIDAYTRAGAWLLQQERVRGSIATGMAADLVVLDRDLFTQPPLGIHAARVDMTVIGGVVVFERPGS